MTTVDKAALQLVLDLHEIKQIVHSPGPHGWWVTVAECRCGHTAPPEARAGHLADEAVKAHEVWLLQ